MTESATPYAEDFEYRGYRIIQPNAGGMAWIYGAGSTPVGRAPFLHEAVDAVDATADRDARIFGTR